MPITQSKRNFLFARAPRRRPMRPPWAVAEERFIELCDRCGDCVRECPNECLRVADGGFPELFFQASGCEFCELCVAVCKVGALDRQVYPPLQLAVKVDDSCFSARGVICRACGDVCAQHAIRFRQQVGGIALVQLETARCNGCGECVSVCPADSLSIQHLTLGEISE